MKVDAKRLLAALECMDPGIADRLLADSIDRETLQVSTDVLNAILKYGAPATLPTTIASLEIIHPDQGTW